MNVLFIGYWGANEGLSKATIYPHLKILCQNKHVTSVTYLSLERQNPSEFGLFSHSKLDHYPVYIEPYKLRWVNKMFSFFQVRRQAAIVVRNRKIHLVICRSGLAGIFGDYLKGKFQIPYWVESFEPHNEYMIETGIWKRGWISDRLYKASVARQLTSADFLLPVSKAYARRLAMEGIPGEKIMVLPCTVDIDQFAFNLAKREVVRSALGIEEDCVVGIYVGKFGGLYLKDEALEIFNNAAIYFGKFHLIILTPSPGEVPWGLQDDVKVKRTVLTVDHSVVPDYLSASDFAFAIYRPGNAMKYLSPIKVGEYWSNGLPVLLTEGVADESAIIELEGGGALFDLHEASIEASLEASLNRIHGLIGKRNQIALLAKKYRGSAIVENIYNLLISIFADRGNKSGLGLRNSSEK